MKGDLQGFAGAYEVLAGYYDQLMDEIDYERWCDYVLSLVEAPLEESDNPACTTAEPWPRRVLDLACGTGQFAYRLRQRDLEVTAVDISSEMLAVAEAKARSLNLDIRFLRQDMRHLELPGGFDMVCCLCDSLNYLLEPDDLAATFGGVFQVLKPGGHFVFDVNTEHKLATVYGNNTYAADWDDFAYIWENEYQPDTKLCYMDLVFFVLARSPGRSGDGPQWQLFEKLTESHVQRAFSPGIIGELVKSAGFDLLAQYGDLTFASPNPTTERITYHCRKPLHS